MIDKTREVRVARRRDCSDASRRLRLKLRANRIYRIDAIEGLKKIEDESVDLVVTDPPYNIASKNKSTIQQGRLMTTAEAWGEWDTLHPFDHEVFIMQVLSQCYRVLKPGGALYMFTARETNGFFIRKAVQRGFTYQNQLVMAKTTQLPSWSKRQWRSAFELCFYVSKGKVRTFNFLSQRECVNLYQYSIRHKQTKHPTEKPLAFIKKLVLINSNAGELVLDPFMGSGTTAVAAKETGRQFIGFEINPDYIKMARERLKGGATKKKSDGTKRAKDQT